MVTKKAEQQFLPNQLHIYNKSTACGCQGSAAAAFRNRLGMFDNKQQYYLCTLNGSIIILSGFRMTHFERTIKLCFLKGPIKTFDLILNMAINTGRPFMTPFKGGAKVRDEISFI